MKQRAPLVVGAGIAGAKQGEQIALGLARTRQKYGDVDMETSRIARVDAIHGLTCSVMLPKNQVW